MVVNHGIPSDLARVPHVEAVLPLVVETQSEEPDVLDREGVILGVFQNRAHQGLVQRDVHRDLLEPTIAARQMTSL